VPKTNLMPSCSQFMVTLPRQVIFVCMPKNFGMVLMECKLVCRGKHLDYSILSLWKFFSTQIIML